MQRKIKLEEISPYLPYGLRGFAFSDKDIIDIVVSMGYEPPHVELLNLNGAIELKDFTPAVRPLSDLTKEIEHNGKRFVPLHKLLENNCFNLSKMTDKDILEYLPVYQHLEMITFGDIKLLFKWHFDVFNWIEDGIAVNINEL